MLTTLVYSLLALDQTVAQIAAQYGHWLYLFLFLDHLRRDGPRRDAVPARRLDPVHRRDGRGDGGSQRPPARRSSWSPPRSSAIRSTIRSATTSARASFDKPDSRWFKQEHLRRTQAFYDRYGGVTIIIGRFVPIIRTFAPFLAGVAGMTYRRFLSYNVVGAVLWIVSLVYAGYLFGNIPWVKHNLTLIVFAIVAISLIPAVTTFIRERRSHAP